MAKNKLLEFVNSGLIDILIEESESRGRGADAARKMLIDLYQFQLTSLRNQEIADADDLSSLKDVSYKALEAEMRIRGVGVAADGIIEIALPPLEENN